MSDVAQRIGVLLITLLFIVTTVGVTVYAIYANKKQEKPQISQEELEKLAQEQPKEEVMPITCTVDTSLNYTPQPPLAGKALPNFVPQSSIGELSCIEIAVGTGEEVPAGATVTAHYTGAVASTGTVFQSSKDGGSPIPFSLNGVIAGWTQGVPGMKVGGIRRINIPANLAYGQNPPAASGIPANADLVFDVEIVKIGE